MKEDEVIRRAHIIANDPRFYVEARVGSENHRGQCCRALYGDSSFNDRADDVIRLFAERIVDYEERLAAASRVSASSRRERRITDSEAMQQLKMAVVNSIVGAGREETIRELALWLVSVAAWSGSLQPRKVEFEGIDAVVLLGPRGAV